MDTSTSNKNDKFPDSETRDKISLLMSGNIFDSPEVDHILKSIIDRLPEVFPQGHYYMSDGDLVFSLPDIKSGVSHISLTNIRADFELNTKIVLCILATKLDISDPEQYLDRDSLLMVISNRLKHMDRIPFNYFNIEGDMIYDTFLPKYTNDKCFRISPGSINGTPLRTIAYRTKIRTYIEYIHDPSLQTLPLGEYTAAELEKYHLVVVADGAARDYFRVHSYPPYPASIRYCNNDYEFEVTDLTPGVYGDEFLKSFDSRSSKEPKGSNLRV